MIYTVFATILLLYAIGLYLLHTLPEAYPGGSGDIKTTRLKRISRPMSSSYIGVGGFKYRRFVVSEDQEKFGLKGGDILEVCCERDPKEDDLIVILQNTQDFRGYKIRRVYEISGENILTFYYDGDGRKRLDNYKPNDIIGVVDEKKT